MVITDKREIERRVKNIKLRAVILKDMILDVKNTTGIDMRDDIMEFFKDRFDGPFWERQRKLLNEKDKFIIFDEI